MAIDENPRRAFSYASPYGIEFKVLAQEDIELVRTWRNSPEICQFMEYREHITEEMQKKWFAGLDPEKMHYHVFVHQGEKIGLGHMKDIDWSVPCGHVGLFFIRDYTDSLIPYQVAFASLDTHFHRNGFRHVEAQIFAWNRRAVRFARSLGYQPLPGQEGLEKQIHRLTREAYDQTSPPMKRVVLRAVAAAGR